MFIVKIDVLVDSIYNIRVNGGINILLFQFILIFFI